MKERITHLAVLTIAIASFSTAGYCFDKYVVPDQLWSLNGIPPGFCDQPIPEGVRQGSDPYAMAQSLVAFANSTCNHGDSCTTWTYEAPACGAIFGSQTEHNGVYDFGNLTCTSRSHWAHNRRVGCDGNAGDYDWPFKYSKNCTDYPGSGPADGFDEASGRCVCENGWNFVPEADRCVRVKDIQKDQPKTCGVGNPIYPLTGTKRQEIEIDVGLSLPLRLTYDMHSMEPGHIDIAQSTAPYSFGPLWGTSFHKSAVRQFTSDWMLALRGGGITSSFTYQSNKYTSDSYSDDVLTHYGYDYKYRYTDRKQLLMEQYDYDSSPIATKVAAARGGLLTYTFSAAPVADIAPIAGLIIAITDQFGRVVRFDYELPQGQSHPRIYRAFDVAGQEIDFGYDSAGNLNKITWPDGKVKTLVYGRSDLPWALTGIIDEESIRYATFGYDAAGRATSTEHAGATNKFVAAWTTPPTWQISEWFDAGVNVVWREHAWSQPLGTQVQNPLGTWVDLGAEVINGMPRQTSSNQPGGSGCGESSSLQSYDTRGNVLSRLDFGEPGVDRKRTCYAYDTNRNVQTFRAEGLHESDVCPADLSAHQVDPNKTQRKISTKWHPLWNLEAQRSEPKLITTTVYNGQLDPIAGDTPDCASGAPLLPDGVNKIAVVCRRYEQSTTDETGNLGFTAPVTETRKWSYTYNQYGQIKLETDPRGKPTSYEYWPDTSFPDGVKGHWMGDLMTVTNALGQKTQYLEYNKRGQALTIQQPNNSLELREYHVRGWPTKVTLRPAGALDALKDQVTQYDYYATGLLKTVTQPDGSVATYTYDDAHRLREVKDLLGNKVTYTLDNAGNRTKEEFTDPTGVLAKTISRTFDALGRLSKATGTQ